MTDDKKLDKAERKRLQIENASHKSPRARILKLADKLSNIRALSRSPAADWSIGRKLEYLKWARAVVEKLKGTNGWLEERFDQATVEAERLLVFRDSYHGSSLKLPSGSNAKHPFAARRSRLHPPIPGRPLAEDSRCPPGSRR